MPPAMTQPRSGSDLQHAGLASLRIRPVAARRGTVALDQGVAQVLCDLQAVAFSDAWNARMDDLGARRGTWDDMHQLLPG